jgi:hypothetical protein
MLRSLWQADRRPLNRVVLSLEHLETRDCPAAPVVTAFTAVAGIQHHVLLSGTVQDNNLAGATVQFSGVASGMTSVYADGTFSFETDASSLGQITATVHDNENLWSNPFSTNIANNRPVINNFQVINRGNGMWELRGQVIDESAAGMVVRFGGLSGSGSSGSGFASLSMSIDDGGTTSGGTSGGASNGQQVTVGSDGWFSTTLYLGANFSGVVSADTTDCWGVASNTVYYLV